MRACRAFLKNQYGFLCSCSVCSLSDKKSQASDRRLGEIAALYAKFATWQDKHLSGSQAIDVVKRIWAIEEEEGYTSERGGLAADTVIVAAAHSE